LCGENNEITKRVCPLSSNASHWGRGLGEGAIKYLLSLTLSSSKKRWRRGDNNEAGRY